jgi:metal-responsive CopG/Arc/MetJ family transcriptional regulator
MSETKKRIMIGIDQELAKSLDEIGFNVKIKTRPSVIAFLINSFVEARK